MKLKTTMSIDLKDEVKMFFLYKIRRGNSPHQARVQVVMKYFRVPVEELFDFITYGVLGKMK
jgi:hypothetical protein